jgi:hypothetical protein
MIRVFSADVSIASIKHVEEKKGRTEWINQSSNQSIYTNHFNQLINQATILALTHFTN